MRVLQRLEIDRVAIRQSTGGARVVQRGPRSLDCRGAAVRELPGAVALVCGVCDPRDGGGVADFQCRARELLA